MPAGKSDSSGQAHQNITLEDVDAHGHLKGVLLSGILGHILQACQVVPARLLVEA